MEQNDSLGCWLKSSHWTRLKSNFGRGSDVDENKSGSPVVKDGKDVWQQTGTSGINGKLVWRLRQLR